MEDKILERIDALAQKMGTTAEYLWEAIVGDVVRRGVAGAAICVVVSIILGVASVKMLNICRSHEPQDIHDDTQSVCGIVSIILGLGCFIALIVAAYHGVSASAPHIEAWEYLVK